jgi:outer membrane receptor for ferrienterochelin and colicins
MPKIVKTSLALFLAWTLGLSDLMAGASVMGAEEAFFSDIPIVISASKRREFVYEAPSAVTSWSAREIRNYGYYTLFDLANVTPGYTGFIKYGESVFTTRGEKADSFNNNKHLVFVDGIPVNHTRGNKAPADNELPVYFARNVEFLRGPASALYGISAFFGVVTVNSGELESNGTLFEQKFSLGNQDGNRRFMSNYLYKTDAGSSKLSFGYYEKKASRALVGPDDSLAIHHLDDQKSLFMNASHEFRDGLLQGFAPGVIVLRRTNGLGENWDGVGAQTSLISREDFDQLIPYLKYKKDLGKLGTVDGYVKGNQSVERDQGPDLSTFTVTERGYYNDVVTTNDGEVMLELNTPIGESFSMINGINYDNRKEAHHTGSRTITDQLLPSTAGNVETRSIFSQLRQELPLLKGMIITLGGRYDTGKATGPGLTYKKMSPRAGIVQKVTDSVTVRVSHGQAIRAPGIAEFGINAESAPRSLITLPDMKPETVTSNEVGASYHVRGFQASVTGFQNKTKNPLNGANLDASLTTTAEELHYFANGSGHVSTKGFEVETRFALLQRLEILANTSWALAKDQDKVRQIDVPSLTANLGVTYDIEPLDLQVSVVDRYVKNYRVPQGSTPPPGSNVVDANLIRKASDTVSFGLQGRNLLNRRYKLPQDGVPNIPMPVRNVTASVDIHF